MRVFLSVASPRQLQLLTQAVVIVVTALRARGQPQGLHYCTHFTDKESGAGGLERLKGLARFRVVAERGRAEGSGVLDLTPLGSPTCMDVRVSL